MTLNDLMPARCWDARLALRYEWRDERTVLAGREHFGPLRVQRDLYPEGAATCHTIIVHPPGGIAGGDRLSIRAGLGDGSAALLTTPGAGKWYRSAGAAASQSLDFEVGADAVLEWLPQENIVFNGADAQMNTRVDLRGNGVFIGWEVLCLGRTASGERFDSGSLGMRTELRRDGRRQWLEQGRLSGGDPLLTSPVGLAGHSVCATLLAAGAVWNGDSLDEAAGGLLAACREVPPGEAGLCGITRLPGVLIARWLGDSSEDARNYFTALWMLLRPAMKNAAAQLPRIWSS
jgi:urease accessory protein